MRSDVGTNYLFDIPCDIGHRQGRSTKREAHSHRHARRWSFEPACIEWGATVPHQFLANAWFRRQVGNLEPVVTQPKLFSNLNQHASKSIAGIILCFALLPTASDFWEVRVWGYVSHQQGCGVGVFWLSRSRIFCPTPDVQLDHFLHHTPKLGIPVEMVQFLMKL